MPDVMPERFQLSRRPGATMPDGGRSVARPTLWGNPFAVGERYERRIPGPSGKGTATVVGHVLSNGHAVELFDWWLDSPWDDLFSSERYTRAFLKTRRAEVLSRRAELRGVPLGCWCAPGDPCHADSWIERANP